MTRLLAIRGEEPPADTVLIIRAGVMSLETLRRTASDSFDDYGAYLISVEGVLGDSTIADTCRRSPRIGQRYGKVRISTAGRLRSAGLALLATFASPHFDVVLPDLSDETLVRLTCCFGEPLDNPGRDQSGVPS